MNKTIEMLDLLSDHLHNRYDAINCGGCGVVAATLAEALMCFRDDVSDVQIRNVVPWESDNIGRFSVDIVKQNAADSNIRAWQEAANEYIAHGLHEELFFHVVVLIVVGGVEYVVDSTGAVPRDEHRHGQYLFDDPIPLEDMKDLADNPVGWNRMFNRQQIAHMELDILEFVANVT